MMLAWQIVRKDLVRLKWILVLWAVVLTGGLGLATIQAGLDHETYFPFYIAAKVIVSWLVPLIVFGLVMGLLHDDPVADIDAFWITRPISGGDLLAAKAVAVLLLGFIPIVVMIPFWLSHDYGWGQVILAARQTLRSHLIVTALALPFAVISANGSKFVTNTLFGAGSFLVLLLLSDLGNSRSERLVDPGLIQSKAWVVSALWVATTISVTLNQFMRRRLRQSLGILTVAVISGFLVAKWWPWKLDFVLSQTESSVITENGSRREFSVLSAKIDGEIKPVRIVAEVPLRDGAASSRGGTTLKIQTVFLDLTGELYVSFSEASPQLRVEFRDLLPGALPRKEASVYYFIINRSDDHAIAVKPSRQGSQLSVATLRFSHATTTTRPANSWHGNPPPNLAAWLKSAVLLKTVAADFRPAGPALAATPFPP